MVVGHDLGAMVLYKNNPVIIGGYTGPRIVATVESFIEVAENDRKWKLTSQLAHPLQGLSALVIEEILYIFGGYDGRSAHDLVYFYNEETERWTMFEFRLNKGRSVHF